MALLSEVAARFGVPRRRLAVAVEAAERLSREEFALLQELLLLQTLGLERRRAMAEGLREAMAQYRTSHSDPLKDVDDPMGDREAAVAVFWSDVEARANRARLLRGCVSAEEAGRLTGRSRQAVEKQRRSGRMSQVSGGSEFLARSSAPTSRRSCGRPTERLLTNRSSRPSRATGTSP